MHQLIGEEMQDLRNEISGNTNGIKCEISGFRGEINEVRGEPRKNNNSLYEAIRGKCDLGEDIGRCWKEVQKNKTYVDT